MKKVFEWICYHSLFVIMEVSALSAVIICAHEYKAILPVSGWICVMMLGALVEVVLAGEKRILKSLEDLERRAFLDALRKIEEVILKVDGENKATLKEVKNGDAS